MRRRPLHPVRLLASAVAAVLLGMPALLSALMAGSVVSRESCGWSDRDFCSDYGPFYWALSGLFALALIIVLWAVNRRRGGN